MDDECAKILKQFVESAALPSTVDFSAILFKEFWILFISLRFVWVDIHHHFLEGSKLSLARFLVVFHCWHDASATFACHPCLSGFIMIALCQVGMNDDGQSLVSDWMNFVPGFVEDSCFCQEYNLLCLFYSWFVIRLPWLVWVWQGNLLGAIL